MKQAVARWLAIVAWACGTALAADALPPARDLQKDARAARDLRGVVVLVFSGDDCRYCRRALHDYLIPMSQTEYYRARVVMRQVEAFSDLEMKDFQGRRIPHRALAARHGVRVVPTVLVVDFEGRPLAKPVVGLLTEDFYTYYLDQAISEGLDKVRGAAPQRLGAR